MTNNKFLQAKYNLERTLDGYKPLAIPNFVINDDLSIDVFGDVVLEDMDYHKIPYKFRNVHGNFSIGKNRLITLENAPEFVSGNFYCNSNELKSLYGGPKIVNGDFYCNNNNLTTLKYAPKIVSGDFLCGNNSIKSLRFLSKGIKGFYGSYNKIEKIIGLPKIMNGDLTLLDNNIIDFNGLPEIINGNCNLASYTISRIKDLTKMPKVIKGDLNLHNVCVESLNNNFEYIKDNVKINVWCDEFGIKNESELILSLMDLQNIKISYDLKNGIANKPIKKIKI